MREYYLVGLRPRSQCACVHVYLCVCVYMCVCVCMCVCVYACVCVRMRAYACVSLHVRAVHYYTLRHSACQGVDSLSRRCGKHTLQWRKGKRRPTSAPDGCLPLSSPRAAQSIAPSCPRIWRWLGGVQRMGVGLGPLAHESLDVPTRGGGRERKSGACQCICPTLAAIPNAHTLHCPPPSRGRR